MAMERALKNVMAALGSPGDASRMATCNPAKVIVVEEEKGSLAPGKDVVSLFPNEDLIVGLAMVKGQIIYQAKEHMQL